MGATRASRPDKLGIVVLLALAILGISVRPLTLPHGNLDRSFGFRRQAIVAEAGNDSAVPLPPLGAALTILPTPLLGRLRCLLKRRRAAYRPVPVSRLKLLPQRTTDSPLPD